MMEMEMKERNYEDFFGGTSFGKEVPPNPFQKTLVFLTIGNR